MKNIFDKPQDTVIHIEITNACNRSCSNCVRLCGHYRPEKIFYVNLSDMAKYLEAFKDFHGWVGCIGGEPTLHPEFKEVCYLMKQYRRPMECGIWTNTLTQEYRDNIALINDTFGLINRNPHNTNVTHTPVLVRSDSVISDPVERMAYIDNCWLQSTWSATITPKGAYFCEVAAMLAWLYDGPDGWDATDPAWWRRTVPEYKEQIDWACRQCSAALPLMPRPDNDGRDDVSQDQLDRLIAVKSPKALRGKCEVYNMATKGFLHGQNRARNWYWNGEPGK